MRRMSISANALPLEGGQGLNLFHMIQGLRESFDLAVFCQGSNGDGSKDRTVPIHGVPRSRKSHVIGSIPVVRRLRDWQSFFSNSDFDRYVASKLTAAALFQGATGQCAESLLAAKQHGCKTVLDVVTVHVDDFIEQQRKECLKFDVRPTLHRGMRFRVLQEYDRADLIRVMSNHASSTFLKRGFSSDRIVVAPPPLDVQDFPEAKFDEPIFRVSFVGLIEPWKGFHYLIDAFNALDLPDSELVLWGGPGARGITRYLQEKMANNPRIKLRPVSVRRVGYGQVYGKSSVLVLPSLADGFGYTVAEAMASGIPVITTHTTGASDLIADGQNGFLVPPADSDAIRDRLQYLATNPARVREMGKAARQTMKAFTMENFRATYVHRLENL